MDMIRDALPIAAAVIVGSILVFPVLKAARFVELMYLGVASGLLKLLTYGPFIIVATTFFLAVLFGISFLAATVTKDLIRYLDNK